jgi:hypothetical protein
VSSTIQSTKPATDHGETLGTWCRVCGVKVPIKRNGRLAEFCTLLCRFRYGLRTGVWRL